MKMRIIFYIPKKKKKRMTGSAVMCHNESTTFHIYKIFRRHLPCDFIKINLLVRFGNVQALIL